MASIVGICNSALIKLGASAIISLTEGSKNANLCSEQYPKIRDDLLRGHIWNFAITRARLARLSMPPAFGPSFAFQLPSDWLRTVSVHSSEDGEAVTGYKLEGRSVVTDTPAVYLKYIRQITDPNEMSAGFREALAWRLAYELAHPIVQSSTAAEQMMRGFESALARSRSVDAIEDSPDFPPESDWVLARS